MVSTAERLPILISGAGNIGSVLIKHTLDNPKLLVSIFIRDASKHKDLISQVEAKGGKVFIGESEDASVLEQATKGIHTFVNTLYPRGDEAKFINSQKLMIDAAVKNGVARFYPNEYGSADAGCTDEQKKLIPVLAWQQAVQAYLKTQPIKSVIVRSGLWHFVFPFFFGQFGYYGDINQKINFIDIDDFAELIVSTLVEKDFSGSVYFSGSRVSIAEAAKIYNKVRGASIESKSLGPIEDIKKQAQDASTNDALDPQSKLMPALKYLMYSGAFFQEKDDNKRFTNKEVAPIDEYFKKTDLGGAN